MKNIKSKIVCISILCSSMASSTELQHPHASLRVQAHNQTPKHGMDHSASMHGMYGNYAMNRDSSGTAWLPDSSPLQGIHRMKEQWMLMIFGYSYFVIDNQRGKRGGQAVFDENMFMLTAQKDFGNHTFAFRSMFSAEPFTVGKCGYPLLFQTGETCDGVTPLLDRQHPHDLFTELAIAYSYRFKDKSSLFLYFGLPGEPALGPPVYFMRFSSEYIPETPLTHHWVDSTHITFGVLTAGIIINNIFKFELSGFRGREPDQNRYDIEKPQFDSVSFRLSLNPTENLAFQTSFGFLKSPEQLEPLVNVARVTLSCLYNKPFGEDNNMQTAAIVGINDEKFGSSLPAFLLETTVELKKKHMFFGRFESVKKDELFIHPDPLADKEFLVNKLTLGYIAEFKTDYHLKFGIGGLLDFPIISKELKRHYGDTFSYMFFFQVRLEE